MVGTRRTKDPFLNTATAHSLPASQALVRPKCTGAQGGGGGRGQVQRRDSGRFGAEICDRAAAAGRGTHAAHVAPVHAHLHPLPMDELALPDSQGLLYAGADRPPGSCTLHTPTPQLASNCAKAVQASSEIAVGTLW